MTLSHEHIHKLHIHIYTHMSHIYPYEDMAYKNMYYKRNKLLI